MAEENHFKVLTGQEALSRVSSPHELADQLAKFSHDLFVETYLSLGSDPLIVESYAQFTFTPTNLFCSLKNPKEWFLVIYDQKDQLKGYCQYDLEPCPTAFFKSSASPMVHISRFYIDATFRGKGYGSKMMNQMVQISLSKGASGIWLQIFEPNRAARRFYERAGFEYSGEVPWIHEAEGKVQKDLDLVFCKTLS